MRGIKGADMVNVKGATKISYSKYSYRDFIIERKSKFSWVVYRNIGRVLGDYLNKKSCIIVIDDYYDDSEGSK